MSEAIITGIVGIVVCMINNYFQHKKTLSLIEYRLKQLEEKVDKHNHFDDRIHKIEKMIDLIDETEKVEEIDHRLHDIERCKDVFDEKLKVANNRISDLERK